MGKPTEGSGTPSARTYTNGCEQAFACLAREHGWTVSKRGWPDFACFGPGGEVIAVEVKPRLKNGQPGLKVLRREQAAVFDWLTSRGIRCFVSDGQSLEVYARRRHADDSRRRRPAADK